MGDCHSFDPGSKFGLEDKKKKIPPNGHPGPGAAHTSFSVSNSNLEKLQHKVRNRDSPPSKTELYGTLLQQRKSSASLRSEKRDADCSPLMENSSLPVENRVMHTDGDNDSEETLLMPQATTT